MGYLSTGHKGKKNHGSGRKGYWRSPPTVSEFEKHPLVVAVKQSQKWARIIDAIPDEETKQLALAEYEKIGEMLDKLNREEV